MPSDLTAILPVPFAEGTEPEREASEQFLLQAFRSFAGAAASLERSYGLLRSEVARLNGELRESHAGLERSLEENRRMRRHLDRILDGLPCGVLVAKADGAISLINPEGQRLLGSHGADAAKNFDSLAAVPAKLREFLLRARNTDTEQEERFDCRERGNNNNNNNNKEKIVEEERWLAVRHAAVQDAEAVSADGGESVSIFILRDVSESKRLVRERDRLRREQALAEMSAILAHEIRNPLASLELFAGLLARAGLPSECRAWVEHVQAGLRTLAATVNNVLHFHSLPAPQLAATDLGQLLDWAGGFLVPMARQARVELCPKNRLQGVIFAADRHRLEQVLLNLVLNALRAMPGGGWVEISGHVTNEHGAKAALVSVSDTGPGIAAEELGKIFEAGFSTRAGSPGLGLAVCRKIVEQHGGTLAAHNRAGGGATFTMKLPLPEILPLIATPAEGTQEIPQQGAGE
jgi:two-component system sensor histidine kinase FlrB